MEENFKLTDLPKNERPREKLLRYGAETLSNGELLAIILRTGSKSENILSLCNRILCQCGGINGLLNSEFEGLQSLKGIGEAKATQLIALSELSKRFKTFKSGSEIKITQPQNAAEYVMEDMRYLKKEYLKLIMLNTKKLLYILPDLAYIAELLPGKKAHEFQPCPMHERALLLHFDLIFYCKFEKHVL